MGKINLGKVAPDIVNNLEATLTGSALDAVQGRILAEKLKEATDVHVIERVNTDLNSYTENGIYYFSSEYTPANIPYGVNGWLIVIKNYSVTSDGEDAVRIKQIWFRDGTPDRNDFNTYIRTLGWEGESVWSSWAKLMTSRNLVSGSATIAVPSANTTYSQTITFDEPFPGTPNVTATPLTAVPARVSVSVGSISETGFILYIQRTDTNTGTGIRWIAAYN